MFQSKRSSIMMVVVFCMLAIFASPAVALNGFEIQITTNTADQTYSAIGGTYLVYSESRNANRDIYLYNVKRRLLL